LIADILHKLPLSEEEKTYPYYPRPSLAGPERCIRQLVYFGLDMPKEPLPGRTYYVFDDGHWHEELSIDWIRKSAFEVHSQQMKVDCGMEKGIHLFGSIDGIITDIVAQDYLLEHKALNHFTCQRYWTGKELPKDYITQCCLYLRGLHKVNPDLTMAILLIKNKNTAAYLEYLIRYDRNTDRAEVLERVNSQGEHIDMAEVIDNVTSDAFGKFALVQDYIDRQTLPKRQYEPDSWQCEYCGYNRICYANYAEEFKELKTAQMLPDEIADMVRYRKEVSAHRLEMEKEEKDLAFQIKTMMKDADTREGRAGEYICALSLVERVSIDKKLIPQEILDKAKKMIRYEKLNIRKIKEGGANEQI